MLEVGSDRAASQASQITVASGNSGRSVILVLEYGASLACLQMESLILIAVKHAAVLAASITVTGAGHDISKLDTPSLAVPEEDTEHQEDDSAKGGGQSNQEFPLLGNLGGLGLGKLMSVKVDFHLGRLILVSGALDIGH